MKGKRERTNDDGRMLLLRLRVKDKHKIKERLCSG